MLPPVPPKLSNKDFDPATMAIDDDIEMETDEVESKVELSSVEINILIYLYLLESNFSHTAFALLNESNLPQTSLYQHFNAPSSSKPPSTGKVNGTSGPVTSGGRNSPVVPMFGRPDGKIERGELVRKLWKGLRWEEVERHVAANGEPHKPACPNPFHLIIPHTCPPSFPSSSTNPPNSTINSLRPSSPPPKRSEPFPPPESSAGPSRPNDPPKGKRKARRPSIDSSSRNPSPARSTSPAKDRRRDKEKGEKKRARISETSTIGEKESSGRSKKERDEEDGSRRKEVNGKERVKVKVKKRVLGNDEELKKSPAKKEVIQGAGNPLWIPEQYITQWIEHRDSVACLAWNPKNRDVLATGSSDGTARLWDFSPTLPDSALALSTPKPTILSHKSIETSKKNVTAIAWHPDGTVLATGSLDGVGRLFTPSGQLQGIMSYGRGNINSCINACKFNPSGSMILVAKSDFTVYLFSMGNSYNQAIVECFESHTKTVNDIDWMDDSVFASAGNDHTIFIFRSNDRRPRFTLKGHTDDVTRVKWSPLQPGQSAHDRLLASVADDGNLMIWRLPHYPDDASAHSRSISPTRLLTTNTNTNTNNSTSTSVSTSGRDGDKKDKEKEKDIGSDEDYFQDTTKGVLGIEHCIQRLQVVGGEVENKRMDVVEWSPFAKEGRMIVAAGAQDSAVHLFDALSGELLHKLPGLESGTGSIAFSPPGFGGSLGCVAGGGWNGKLIIWDVESGNKLKEYEVDEDPNRQAGRDKPMMVSRVDVPPLIPGGWGEWGNEEMRKADPWQMSMQWREDGQQIALGLQNKSVLGVYVGDLAGGASLQEGK